MRMLARTHRVLVHDRRVRVLAERIGALIPESSDIVDVGCGDGRLAASLVKARSDVTVRGLDVLGRKDALIPVEMFDGRRLPMANKSVDVVMIVDVLHHADDPLALLAECARVTRRALIIKDHLLDGFLALPTLRLMDWVGNAPHGVSLPYNYWPRSMWHKAFSDLNLEVRQWTSELGLYSWPASTLFERNLHFLAVLQPTLRPAA